MIKRKEIKEERKEIKEGKEIKERKEKGRGKMIKGRGRKSKSFFLPLPYLNDMTSLLIVYHHVTNNTLLLFPTMLNTILFIVNVSLKGREK
jgi:hypothetical protein